MTTRGYEALIILKAAGTEQEIAQRSAQLEEPIKRVGGIIESSQAMGRRRFAFRISKQTEGHYHLLRFQAPTEQLAELERLLRLDESIVRFMILAQDETARVPSLTAAARS
jgi:small subunit ribosomal protein S6